MAPGVPKVEKANGAKGPLIPRKGRLCGLWRKNELETPGDKEVSPNSLCPAWELLSSPEARGSLGRGWRGGEGTEALHLGSANTEGGDPSPSSPGCPKRQDRWRWREVGRQGRRRWALSGQETSTKKRGGGNQTTGSCLREGPLSQAPALWPLHSARASTGNWE